MSTYQKPGRSIEENIRINELLEQAKKKALQEIIDKEIASRRPIKS